MIGGILVLDFVRRQASYPVASLERPEANSLTLPVPVGRRAAQRITWIVTLRSSGRNRPCPPVGAGPCDGADVSRRRATVDRKRFDLHIGGDGPEQRRLRLISAVGAAQSLDRSIGLPSGFKQIVHAQPSILRRQLRVIGTPGTAASEKTRMRLTSSMNACASPRFAKPVRSSTARRSTPSAPRLRMIRRERPVTSATMSVPKRCTIWSSAP